MKRITLIIVLITSFSCQSQSKKMLTVANEELNYVLSNIFVEKIYRKELFKGEAHLTLFEIADSKATKDDTFQETDEVLSSYYISVIPYGDYYTTSKLYKIEGLLKPKIVMVKEEGFPDFSITVEYGQFNNRINKNYTFKITN